MSTIFDGALSGSQRERAEHTLSKLLRHDVSRWVLTGSFATEFRLREKGRAEARDLHDIDFVVDGFDCIPESLALDFLLRHIHPDDPPGKTLLQCVDPDTRVRVDVFRTTSDVVRRAAPIESGVKALSTADLTARSARLTWDLMSGKSVAPKFIRDFERLRRIAEVAEVEAVWYAHRNASSPDYFAMAVDGLRDLLASHSHLLRAPTYSTDVEAACGRCRETGAMKLADPSVVLGLLGYC